MMPAFLFTFFQVKKVKAGVQAISFKFIYSSFTKLKDN